MSPPVTVVIGTYNRADLLPVAINSVLDQTYQDWELLVVDNGSTDHTKLLATSYTDRRIRYVVNEKPTGSCAAPRNIGSQMAKGKYIAFLDDDDVWYPEKLQICMRELESNPYAALVCHAEKVVYGGGLGTVRACGPWSRDIYNRLLYEGNCLSPGGVVIKKEVLVEIGGFDVREEYLGCDDYDLWIRLARNGSRFHFINDVLGEFRVTGLNNSISDPYHSVRLSSMVKKNILFFEGQPHLSPRGRGRMAMLYLLVIRTLLKFGKWNEVLPYIKKLLQCGVAGVTRIGGEIGSRILRF